MISASSSPIITLGGRRFRILGEVTTLAHEEHLGPLVARAGISETMARAGEDLAEQEIRIIQRLLESKTLLPLVACLIVPESAASARPRGAWVRLGRALRVIPAPPPAPGGGWTVEIAARTERIIGQLDDPEDKDQVRLLVIEYLLPFWTRGLASWAASLRSSAQAVQAAAAAASPIPATPTAPGEG